MFDLGSTLRILRPAPNILAFYDGRVPGIRAHGPQANWLDDGAFALGVCTYAVVDGGEALVYDTHISLAHARAVRAAVEAEGARVKYVVLSHWHVDHVAGNEVFQDCPILANVLTAEALAEHREELETGAPPIRPLVMPDRIFAEDLSLTVGETVVELRRLDIHSADATVLLVNGILLAGDTLEDPITYVAEPDRLEAHLADLRRLRGWTFERILPNHGAEEVIAAGGYDQRLIAATQAYVAALLRCAEDPDLAARDLAAFVAEEVASGAIRYFAPYEAVHRQNVRRVLEIRGRGQTPPLGG